jgi:hypothetical protein
MLGSWRGRKRALSDGESHFGPPRLGPVAYAGGVSIVLAQFLVAGGLMSSWLFFFYLLGLLWLLAIATIVFAVLLMESLGPRPSA